MKKEKKKVEILPSDRVRLKAFLGIPPLIYVSVLFSIVIILILFLLSFLLQTGKNTLEIHSFPKNAAVFVDAKYLGTTPVKADIYNINQNIRIQKRGYSKQDVSFQKRNFIQNIFTTKMEYVLELEDPRIIVQDTVEDIAQFVNTKASRRFSIPSTLEDTSEELLSLVQETKDRDGRLLILTTLIQVLYNALPYLQNYERYQEFLKDIFNTHFKEFPSSLTEEQKILVSESSPNIATQLQFIYDYIMKNTRTRQVSISLEQNTKHLKIFDMDFLYVPKQTVQYALTETDKNFELLETKRVLELQSRDITENISIQSDDLYILDHELSIAEFSFFLQEEPDWLQQSSSHVISDFQDTHFDFIGPDSNLLDPVSNITWYDAMAYVQWFNKKLEKENAPYVAAVPNEFQWRAAQQYFTTIDTRNRGIEELRSIKKTLETLQGNLWEWTDSWYSPLPQYNQDLIPLFGSMKILLGGNSKHYEENIHQVLSRNYAYDPAWATKFVGFRIILLPK